MITTVVCTPCFGRATSPGFGLRAKDPVQHIHGLFSGLTDKMQNIIHILSFVE
jgi:hypothetical protein